MSTFLLVNAFNPKDQGEADLGDILEALETQCYREHHLTRFHERIVHEIKTQLATKSYSASDRCCPECGRGDVCLTLDGVEVDYCLVCRGIWFDTGELRHFTELVDDIPGANLATRASKYHCPGCRQRMTQYQFRRGANLMVDGCHGCRGVYLQDREFERALEISERVEDLAGNLSEAHLKLWHAIEAQVAAGGHRPSTVPCPECGERDVVLNVNGQDVDYCLSCSGFWFETGELKEVTEQNEDIPGQSLAHRNSPFACPRCRRRMTMFQFSGTSNLLVESCPKGHGVYLRRGELARALQISEHIE